MIDLKKNKTFCPYPFKAALLEHSNDTVVPCCRWNSNSLVQQSKNHLNKDSRDQVMDYKNYFDIVREKMIKGEPVLECAKCYQQEHDGLSSMRSSALNDFVEDTKALEKKQGHRGPKGLSQEITIPKLEYLEIESGRYCNLKCRSCGPGFSSSWDEDVTGNNQVLTNFYGSKHNVFDDLQSKTRTNDSLALLTYKDSQYLNEIKVTGGEPFLTDSFLKFLENLVEWGIAKNIVLDVFTNSSFFPKEKHTQMLTKFKQVDINLSIDAVGERNNFLRKKSKWQVVQDVSKSWEELSIQNNNISIKINHTVTIFNSLYLDEFLNWCNTHFDKKTMNSGFVHVAVAYGPDYLSVRNFSRPIKEKLLQIVTKQWNESNRLFSKSLVDQKFKRIVTALDSKNLKDPIDSVFEEKTEMFDKIRKENWRATFPELAEVFDE